MIAIKQPLSFPKIISGELRIRDYAQTSRQAASAMFSGARRSVMEDHAMSFFRNGYALSTRRRFLGLLFFAVLALVLFVPRSATAQEVRQIKLTEKQIQGFMAAYEDMAKVYDGDRISRWRRRPRLSPRRMALRASPNMRTCRRISR